MQDRYAHSVDAGALRGSGLGPLLGDRSPKSSAGVAQSAHAGEAWQAGEGGALPDRPESRSLQAAFGRSSASSKSTHTASFGSCHMNITASGS